jgi:poly(A) polymerase/tRNA nucleotidyltransferase (CCA-adding enzyme)
MTYSDSSAMDLFPVKVPDDLIFITEKLKSNGFEAFLVGGAVRDIILSGNSGILLNPDMEYDLTTNAKPSQVMALFQKKSQFKVFTVPTGLLHGTVTVFIAKNGKVSSYEITTYRVDSDYKDGRHPSTIRFSSSLMEDLARRDFTINALAYDIQEKIIIDPYQGLNDLKKGIIRTVGDPLSRFSEDGLRPVRACRFAAQLDFIIDENTFNAVAGSLDTVRMVSPERIHDELIKLMKTRKPSLGIEYLRKTGILEIFIPELLEGYKHNQNEFHKFDVYYHNLYTCDAVSPAKPLVRLAGLFHDIGKPRAQNFACANGNGNVFYNHEVIGEKITEKILKRLKFSNNELKKVKKLVKFHMFYYTEEWSDGAVRRFLRKLRDDTIDLEDLFELRKADRIGSGLRSGDAEILDKFKKRIGDIINEDNALKVTDLDINGHEIMQRFGIGPSKIIGEMLEYMLQRVLDNPEFNQKEKLYTIGEEFLKTKQKPSSENRTDEMPILI